MEQMAQSTPSEDTVWGLLEKMSERSFLSGIWDCFQFVVYLLNVCQSLISEELRSLPIVLSLTCLIIFLLYLSSLKHLSGTNSHLSIKSKLTPFNCWQLFLQLLFSFVRFYKASFENHIRIFLVKFISQKHNILHKIFSWAALASTSNTQAEEKRL